MVKGRARSRPCRHAYRLRVPREEEIEVVEIDRPVHEQQSRQTMSMARPGVSFACFHELVLMSVLFMVHLVRSGMDEWTANQCRGIMSEGT